MGIFTLSDHPLRAVAPQQFDLAILNESYGIFKRLAFAQAPPRGVSLALHLADNEMQSRIDAQKSGEPLPAPTEAEMEAVAGGDLSGVRLHTDFESGRLAGDQGRDVFFPHSAFDQSSEHGRATLTHELHTGRKDAPSPVAFSARQPPIPMRSKCRMIPSDHRATFLGAISD
jgi:uncharacterized protein DUF4157